MRDAAEKPAGRRMEAAALAGGTAPAECGGTVKRRAGKREEAGKAGPDATAPGRADRHVMLFANTSSLRFVAILAPGPFRGQRKPVIGVNGP